MGKFIFLICLLLSQLALAVPAETTLTFKSGVFSHFVSHDLTAINPKIQKVIITLHGSERNAHTYYNAIDSIVKKQSLVDKVLIIAPHFKEVQDPRLAQEFYFNPEGWLRGDNNLNGKAVSSFEIMDHLISELADKKRFPSLKEVVITGHSAGGQLAQRYAAGSLVDSKYPWIHFRYVVANPGTYLYMTTKRPVSPNIRCAFNEYKYGLDRLNSYMGSSTKGKITARYTSKEVIYFLGEMDNRSDNIEQSCPAQYQGKNRLERGRLYKQQLGSEFPSARHFIFTVPGVGHTQYGMYTSEIGQKVLFQKL